MKGATNQSTTGSRQQLKVLLLLPFFTSLLYFLLAFVFFPVYIYRTGISFLGKWWDPQVTKILTGLSASLLRDIEYHRDKPLSTIVVCLKGRGTPDYVTFRDVFERRIVLKSRGAELLFPELQQYYRTFMGYVFLKWDLKFRINNHISLLKSPTRGRRELMEVWQNLMVKPFPKNRSPWEVILLETFTPDDDSRINFIVFLRIHHAIADGFSVQHMLTLLDETVDGSSEPYSPVKLGTARRLLMNFRTAILGPYDMLHRMVTSRETYHTLHLPYDQQAKRYFVVESPIMSVDKVKKVKDHFEVAFTSVLLSIVGGGIRRFLVENRKPFPAVQMLGIPFVTEGHRIKLGNDFLIATLPLPIHLKGTSERVYEIQRQLEKLYKSSISQMLGLTIDLLSFLPVRIVRKLTRKSVFSTAYSTLPGPTQVLGIGGMRLEEVNFTYGTGAASLGLCFSSITYQGKLRMTIFVDRALVGSWEKAEEMIHCVTQEYYDLCEVVGSSRQPSR